MPHKSVPIILCSFLAAATVRSADEPGTAAREILNLMHRVNNWQIANPYMKEDDRNVSAQSLGVGSCWPPEHR